MSTILKGSKKTYTKEKVTLNRIQNHFNKKKDQ